MDRKEFIFDFSVRGYELDSFGHVNNAVYFQYFEQARWEILNELGLLKMFQESGNFLIVIEVEIRYVNELKIFEKASVTTQMYVNGPFLMFKHRMTTPEHTKARATIKCLFVTKEREPLDIPKVLMKHLSEPIKSRK